jgi:CheY-like chemotaxis protein
MEPLIDQRRDLSRARTGGRFGLDLREADLLNFVANAGQYAIPASDILVTLDGTQRGPVHLEIVRGHGGNIDARSSDASTRLTVSLPRHTPVASFAPGGRTSNGPKLAGTHGPILLVEDDVDVRESLADTLEDLGYDVVTAVHGLDALNLLLEKRIAPSVILLDLMMPVMDGYRFLEEIRKHQDLSGIPIAVVTAGHRVDRTRLGVVPIIPKPIKLPQLKSTLERLSGTGGAA